MKFFYQISAKAKEDYDWHQVYKGIIEGEDKKIAKKNLNEMFDQDFKEKITRGKTEPEFRLFLVPLTEYWDKWWCSERTCKICSKQYTIIDTYQKGDRANDDHCSEACQLVHRKPFIPQHVEVGYGNVKPTIYKITNRITNLSYIGKSIRPFTLRWWEHFFHPSDTKFHTAIKDSVVTDWVFEVVEILDKKINHQEMLKREQFWIDKFDTVKNGYNSVVSVKNDDEVDLSSEGDHGRS